MSRYTKSPPSYNGTYPYGGSYAAPYSRAAPIYDNGYYNRPYQYQQQRGDTWSEFIPVEQRYTDYVAEQRVEYVPVEKNYTDYIEVQHQTDYVPVPRMEKRVEYIPVEKYDEHVDYMPVQRSNVVRTPQSRVGGYSGYVPGPTNYSSYYPGYQQQYSGYQSRYRQPGYGYRYL